MSCVHPTLLFDTRYFYSAPPSETVILRPQQRTNHRHFERQGTGSATVLHPHDPAARNQISFPIRRRFTRLMLYRTQK